MGNSPKYHNTNSQYSEVPLTRTVILVVPEFETKKVKISYILFKCVCSVNLYVPCAQYSWLSIPLLQCKYHYLALKYNQSTCSTG
jgi:hypothetical protein